MNHKWNFKNFCKQKIRFSKFGMTRFQTLYTVNEICVFFMHPFLLCVESLNSQFWFAHFCLVWPYTSSYRNLIYIGMFRRVRAIRWYQKFFRNMVFKGSFGVAKSKKCKFLVIFGKIIKMFLLIATSIFNIFVIFLAPVDRSKCVDSETTPFFESSPILRWFNWPRSKNGTNFWSNRTIFFGFFLSLWPHISLFTYFLGTSR